MNQKRRKLDGYKWPALIVSCMCIASMIIGISTYVAAVDNKATSAEEQCKNNKKHIQYLEAKEAENRRFQGVMETKMENVEKTLDSIKMTQEKQMEILMELQRNGNGKRDD